jgi:hypothetical protein
MPLTHSLNRLLNRPLGRFLNRRIDGRPCRPPNYLAQACSLLEKYLRLRRQAAKAEPHLFGPHAGEYYRDTQRLAAQDREVAAALDKIYGPAPPGSPTRPSVWEERYSIPPESQKLHRRWFREKYGN